MHSFIPLANIYQNLLSTRHRTRHRDMVRSRTDAVSALMVPTAGPERLTQHLGN